MALVSVARVVVKDDRREQVPVLGHGERRHLQLDRLVEQLVDAARAVEQRELGVQMEMDEIGAHDTCRTDIPMRAVLTPIRWSTAASS